MGHMATGRRQAWDPEPPVAQRLNGPTWHRVGWHQRDFHTTDARLQKEQQQQLQEQQQKQQLLQKQREQLCPFSRQRQAKRQLQRQQQQQAAMQPVVAHTHSTTYMYSFKQASTHKTTLVKQWVPGEGGAPAAEMNMVGLCDELNTRLLNVDATLVAMLSGSQPPHQQLPYGGSELTRGSLEAARQKLGESLNKQMAFSTAVLLDWCGVTPVGSSEQVLQKLLEH